MMNALYSVRWEDSNKWQNQDSNKWQNQENKKI